MKIGVTFPDIRNKLTPIKNIIAMLEYGIVDEDLYSSDYDNNKTNEENLYHKIYYNTGNEGVIVEWVRDYLESKDIKEEDEQF